MSVRTKRVNAAVAGGIALVLAAPMIATAAPVSEGPAVIVASLNGNTYRQASGSAPDPLRGTVHAGIALQSRTDSDGKVYYRVYARLSKVTAAARIQIDSVSVRQQPAQPVHNFTKVNSGDGTTVQSATPWVQKSTVSDAPPPFGTVEYSVRWSDGSLDVTDLQLSGQQATQREDSVDEVSGDVTSTGSVVLNHYGNAALGSARISAGLRLARDGRCPINCVVAVQPYATISKLNTRVVRVQIDGIEARQYFKPFGDNGDSPAVLGWPSNVVPRSSGTGNSAFLSTAYTAVAPRISNSESSGTRVNVFYSIRWSDGTLSKGVYASPLSRDRNFPLYQGF